MLRKLTAAALVGAVALTTSLPASAYYPKPPVPPKIFPHGTSGAGGAAATGGFIAFVAALVTYDLIRRTTCSGDFLYLGGPGFTEKMPTGNVMIPQCPVVKKRRAVVSARG
jgi:hypothetical protein